MLQQLKSKRSLTKIILLLWSIWKERNSIIFSNDTWGLHRVFHIAKFLFLEWQTRFDLDSHQSTGSPLKGALPLFHPPTHSFILTLWLPPPPNSIKLFDCSVKYQGTAAGFIFIDHSGSTSGHNLQPWTSTSFHSRSNGTSQRVYNKPPNLDSTTSTLKATIF